MKMKCCKSVLETLSFNNKHINLLPAVHNYQKFEMEHILSTVEDREQIHRSFLPTLACNQNRIVVFLQGGTFN